MRKTTKKKGVPTKHNYLYVAIGLTYDAAGGTQKRNLMTSRVSATNYNDALDAGFMRCRKRLTGNGFIADERAVKLG
jgi:hypothetical protein